MTLNYFNRWTFWNNIHLVRLSPPFFHEFTITSGLYGCHLSSINDIKYTYINNTRRKITEMVYPNWSECLTLFFVCYFSVPINGRLLYWLFSPYFSWVQHLNKYSTYIYLSLCAKNCGLQGYPAPKCFPGPADGLSSLFYKCIHHSHNDIGGLQVHWR